MRTFRKRLGRMSISWRIFILCVAFEALIGVLSVLMLYGDVGQRIGGRHVARLLTRELTEIAGTAAERLDGDALQKVLQSGSATSPEYAQLQEVLRKVQHEYQIDTDIYTLHRDQNATHFGITCKPTPILGEAYSLRPEMVTAFDGLGLGTTGVYQDQYGWWISVYAPVRDSSGQVVGIAVADHDLVPFLVEARTRLVRGALLAVVVGLVLTAPLSFLASRRITRPLQHLSEVAEKITQGDIEGIRIDTGAPGEVGRLGESFERALVAVRYYISRVQELENPEAAGTPDSRGPEPKPK